jgi:hypothetical protein
MADREKVITDVEEAIKILGKVDELTFWLDFVRVAVERALELLKEQEPRVLTLEEATEDECWFEYINGSCGNADVDMKDNKTAIIYRTNRRPVQVLITDYMKKWRCWDRRPTDEQRKAVKWYAAD